MLATIDLVIIGTFILSLIVIGIYLSKKASEGIDEYFLGKNKIPWWLLGASTATSNFDMAGTMIIVAVVFSLGFKGFFVELRGGVGLSYGFILVFLAKWLRRSRVMTSAEWMKLRFGTDTQGKWAHIFSAGANIILCLGMIVYFAKGAGKFLTYFLPFSEVTCITAMITVGLFYTLLSGLYGVIFTDLIQMIILTFAAVYISIHAFMLRPETVLPQGFFDLDFTISKHLGQSLLANDPGAWEPIFSMFGLCVAMWAIRSMLEGMGGIGGYTDQRFFAAKNERESSLIMFETIILAVFRWTMIAGLVIMGYYLLQHAGSEADIIKRDAEQVLPLVVHTFLPIGIKGLVIAGIMAAAMSTFDSTLNAGAAYLVKDIYQSYINPQATQKQLITFSKLTTLILCILGVLLAAIVPNINSIWRLITMGLGAGMFVPLFLRWYWPRFNGYGFAAGTATGMITAIILDTIFNSVLYVLFPVTVVMAFLASIVVTLLTQATPKEILQQFYIQINPMGFWGAIRKEAISEEKLNPEEVQKRKKEKITDALGSIFAVMFHLSLLLCAMCVIFQSWSQLLFFSILAIIGGIGLYFLWYKNLKSNEACEKDEQLFHRLS